MVFLKKRSFLPTAALVTMMALSACGGSADTNAGPEQTTPTATARQTATATIDPCLTPTPSGMTTPTATAHAEQTATAAPTATAHAEQTANAVATAGVTVTPDATSKVATATAVACATGTTTATGTAASTNAENAAIKTTEAQVAGKEVIALTNAQGMTLYYSEADTAEKSNCTGACAETWKPVLAGTAEKVDAPAEIADQITVVETEHGKQVAYGGHLLYTYTQDTTAGEITGEGVETWHTATAEAAAQQ